MINKDELIKGFYNNNNKSSYEEEYLKSERRIIRKEYDINDI